MVLVFCVSCLLDNLEITSVAWVGTRRAVVCGHGTHAHVAPRERDSRSDTRARFTVERLWDTQTGYVPAY